MKRRKKQRNTPRAAFLILPRTSISVCRVYSISPRAAFLTHPRPLKKCIRIIAKISVCSLWMHIRSLWMAIRSLWMAIRSLQTELLACWPDDFGLLNGLYNGALMGSPEWCHRFRKALGHLSKNCLKSFKWSSDNSPMTLQRVAKEIKKGAQGRTIGFLMTL